MKLKNIALILCCLFIGLIFTQTASAALPTDGLVGWYAFNETSGTTLYDYSGNNNNGVLQNNPVWSEWGLSFSGTSYVNVTSSESLQLTTGSTFIVVARAPESMGSGVMFSKGNSTSEYRMLNYFSGTNGFGVGYGATVYGANSMYMPVNCYHLYSSTFDNSLGSNQVKNYLSGVLASETTKSSNIGTSDNNLFIGNRYALDRPYNGLLSYILIYNRALSPEEMSQASEYVTTQINERGIYLYNVSRAPATLNVKAHGAVGDGVTVDTTKILGTIRTMIAGDTISFPSGTYIGYIDTSTMPLPSNVTITGDSYDQTTLKMPDATDNNCIELVNISNVTIKNITLDGNRDQQSSEIELSDGQYNAVRINNDSSYITVERCRLTNSGYHGIMDRGANDIITDNTIDNNGYRAILVQIGARNSTVTNNICHDNGQGFPGSAEYDHHSPTDGIGVIYNVSIVLVKNNTVYNISQGAQTTIAGINLFSKSWNVTVIDNTITCNNENVAGIYINGTEDSIQNVIISGNTITNSLHGIYAYTIDTSKILNVSITHNYISDTVQTGINISTVNPANVVLHDNLMVDCNDFTATTTSGDPPLTVAFTDTDSYPSGMIINYRWNFGDSLSNSSSQNPTHVYSTTGTFTVILTTINSHGENSEVKTGYIIIAYTPPTITDFTGTPTSGTAPLSVSFLASISTGNVQTWHWDFGDGHASTQANPVHSYINKGNYTVTLTVSNSGGSDSLTKTTYINLSEQYTILKKINASTATYAPISEQNYNDLLNNTMGDGQGWDDFDMPAILATVMSPGPDNFGPFFWIIVFGAIGTFIYIKTDSVIIPGSLFLIGSGLIGPMLLPEFAGIIWGIVIIGFAGLGYILFKSR